MNRPNEYCFVQRLAISTADFCSNIIQFNWLDIYYSMTRFGYLQTIERFNFLKSLFISGAIRPQWHEMSPRAVAPRWT